MGILKKIFITLILIAFPLGEIARIEQNEIAITLVDVLIGFLVLIWAFKNKKFQNNKLLKPLLIFGATLILSLAVNFNQLSSFEFFASSLYLIRWIFYASVYFVVLDFNRNFKNTIFNAMFFCGILVVASGYIQYFLYPDLRNLYYLGWDEHLYRMFGNFLDPNFLSVFLVIFSLFVLEKILRSKDKKFLSVVFFLTLTAIILTFSRSGYVAFVVGIVSFLILKRSKKILLLSFLAFIILVLSILKLTPFSEGTNLFRTASNEARLDSMRNAITVFKDSPIFGVGFNAYRYAQRDYGFIDENKMLVHSGAGTDNSFLFILVTSGVIGFSGFIYLLFKIFSIKDSLIVSSMVSIIASSMFVNSLFFPLIMLWMWVLIGIKENS